MSLVITNPGPEIRWTGCACGMGMPELEHHSRHVCSSERLADQGGTDA